MIHHSVGSSRPSSGSSVRTVRPSARLRLVARAGNVEVPRTTGSRRSCISPPVMAKSLDAAVEIDKPHPT